MRAAPASARLLGPRTVPYTVSAAAIASPWVQPVDYVPEEDPQDASPEEIRILVVAGDPLARAGLAALVGAMPDCRAVGEVPGDAALSEAIERVRPDVVVWDLGQSGVAPDPESLGEGAPPVLVLAPRELPEFPPVPGSAGGVLARDTDVATLAAALRAVARGLVVLDPSVAAVAPLRDRAAVELPEPLTPRELEVLQSLAAGLPNKVIADRLGISEHTVRFHLNAIFGKLEAHTRTEAVSRAVRLGLIVL
jgi:two-component system, NarL family, nitrate/nitrite response regulator NarL